MKGPYSNPAKDHLTNEDGNEEDSSPDWIITQHDLEVLWKVIQRGEENKTTVNGAGECFFQVS